MKYTCPYMELFNKQNYQTCPQYIEKECQCVYVENSNRCCNECNKCSQCVKVDKQIKTTYTLYKNDNIKQIVENITEYPTHYCLEKHKEIPEDTLL